MLEEISQLVREPSQSDGSEKVDGKAGIFGIIPREQSRKRLGQCGILEAGVQLEQSHIFGQLLEQDFDEDSARTGCVLLVEPNASHNVPPDGISEEKMGKELANVPEAVRVQSMGCGVRVL